MNLKVGVVTKVDGKVIEFINIDTDEDELDLSDYDDVYLQTQTSKADAKTSRKTPPSSSGKATTMMLHRS